MTRRVNRDRRLPALVAAALLCGPTACDSVAADGLAGREARLVARGVQVYKEQRCGACHALARAGTAGIFGPGHDSAAALAGERLRDPNYRGAATSVPEYLRESIAEPGVYRVPGFERTHFSMPDYSGLPPEDLDALVFMLSREPE